MTESDTPFKRFQLGGASQHQLQMLAETMKQAPLLESRVTEAMRSRDLTSITAHDSVANAARGFYDGWHREISINRDILDAPIDVPGVDAAVDVMSHEIEHALHRREMSQFAHGIELQAYALLDKPGPQDGTTLVRAYIAKGREQEALAELAGINGLADRMRAEDKGVVNEKSLAERLVRNTDCVERGPDSQFRFKSGIQFDATSQSVPETPDNIDAVAKCFFDTDRGQRGYNARYAASAISAFARADIARRIENSWEPHGRIEIDLAALGVTLEDLRKQPLHFGSHPPGPFEFTDTSNGQKKIVSLMHNGGREPGAPEVGIAAEAAQPAAIPLLSDPAHPAHDLYAQTLRAFAVSPEITAAGYSNERQQLVAANLVAGTLDMPRSRTPDRPTQERLDRVDAATIASDGSYVTLIQRAAQNATSFRFGLPMEQAHAGSIEAASQQAFDGLQQQKAQEIAQQAERDRAPQPEPEGPSR